MSNENESIIPLSIECMLTLMEQMSYDNKQLLISKLERPIFEVRIPCYAFPFLIKAHSINDARQLLLNGGHFFKDINAYGIHRLLFSENDNCRCGFIVCDECIDRKICFICDKLLIDDKHFDLHTINEVHEDILKRYVNKCYIRPYNTLNGYMFFM